MNYYLNQWDITEDHNVKMILIILDHSSETKIFYKKIFYL
jgi:hypothetical protein